MPDPLPGVSPRARRVVLWFVLLAALALAVMTVAGARRRVAVVNAQVAQLTASGEWHYARGEYALAAHDYKYALDALLSLGRPRQRAAAMMIRLGVAEYQMGRDFDAKNNLDQAFAILRKENGASTALPEDAVLALGWTDLRREQPDAARDLFQRIVSLHGKDTGASAPLAESLHGLGETARAQRQYPEAVRTMSAALSHANPAQRNGIQRDLARAYRAQFLFAKAEPVMRQVIATDSPKDLPLDLVSLGGLYADCGWYGRAEPLYRKALRLWDAGRNGSPVERELVLNRMTEVQLSQGRGKAAEALARRSLALVETADATPGDRAWPRVMLGDALFLQRRFPEAARALIEARDLFERDPQAQERSLARTLNDLAAVQAAQGDIAGATASLMNARALQASAAPLDPARWVTGQNMAALSAPSARKVAAPDAGVWNEFAAANPGAKPSLSYGLRIPTIPAHLLRVNRPGEGAARITRS